MSVLNTSIFSTTTTFNIYLRGDAYSSVTDNTLFLLQSFVYYLQDSTSTPYKSFKAFLTSLNSTLTLIRIFSLSPTDFPKPNFGSKFVMSTGINFISVREITLTTGRGLIYGVVVPRTQTVTPTVF